MQRSVFQVCKVGLEPWGEGAALPPKAEWQYLFSQAIMFEYGTQCVYHVEQAPCEHVECRLGMVEAPRCWVKNGTDSCIECYDSVGLGFV